MKFEILVDAIAQTHSHFQQQASKAVNVSLTLRNWLIGFYIVEFEQKGEDRAKYGESLLKNLAERIAIKGLGETNLRLSRQFYNSYPKFRELLSSTFSGMLPAPIRQTLSDEFKHEHLSQLNTYVSYYREEVKRPDDNHPVGILLCTKKGKKLVEYALSGMDNQLFVSKYLLELPKKEQLEAFITNELLKWNR